MSNSKYGVDDIVMVLNGNPLLSSDAGRLGVVVSSDEDTVEVRPIDSVPWNSFPGLGPNDTAVLNPQSVKITKIKLTTGTKVEAMPSGYDGKENDNSTMPSGKRGVVVGVGDRSGRVVVKFDNKQVTINSNYLQRVVNVKNYNVTFKAGDFVAVHGIKEPVRAIEKAGRDCSIQYLNSGNVEWVKANKVRRVIKLADLVRKFLSPKDVLKFSEEKRNQIMLLNKTLKTINEQIRLHRSSGFDIDSLVQSANKVRKDIKLLLSGKDVQSNNIRTDGSSIRPVTRAPISTDHIATLKCKVTGVKSHYNKRDTDSLTSAYLSLMQIRDRNKVHVETYMSNYELYYTGEKKGRVLSKPNQFKTIYDHMVKNLIKLNKSPRQKSKEHYLGIEIECMSTANREQIENLLTEAKLARNCQVASDGSIRTNRSSQQAYEIKVLAKQAEYKDVLSRVLKVLKEVDTEVNHTCGLHVHFDMRNRRPHKAYYNLVNTQNMLFRFANENRRDNRYCTKIPVVPFDERHNYTLGRNIHYDGISTISSYQKYKTFEVRILEGTLDLDRISVWIDTILGIVDHRGKLNVGMGDDVIVDALNISEETKTKFKASLSRVA